MGKEINLNDELKAFTEDQKKVLLTLVKAAEDKAEARAKEVLEAKDKEDEEIAPRSAYAKKDRKRLNAMLNLWKRNGFADGSKEQITIDELIQRDLQLTKEMRDNWSTDHPLMIPRVLSEMAREAIEPNLVLTPLLTRISYSAGTRVVFPAWGAITASDIAEGAEYPERSMELAGQVEATIGKSGVAVKISEEMRRYSQYDIMGMHFRAAGRALARWKEQKVADLITTESSNVIFDNTTPTDSELGSTTGRGPGGAYNGGLTLDDLFRAYAAMLARGFTPNTLIMHPFAWSIFAQEGIARAFGFINGMNPLLWQNPQGAPGNANQWRMGQLNQNTYVSSPKDIATTFTNVPSIFPSTFRIIVSPYMPFTSGTNRTTILFCDASELGILIVDEDVTTEEWNDPARDIMKVKFRERYGLAVMNDGKGIGLMKDIYVGRTYDFADKISLEYTTGAVDLSTDTGYFTAV